MIVKYQIQALEAARTHENNLLNELECVGNMLDVPEDEANYVPRL